VAEAGSELSLEEQVRAALTAAWSPAGFTSPNPATYPWQWLWDSCFHAVVWAELGDDRGVGEIGRLLDARDGEGFVPHVLYGNAPNPHADFWGRAATSSITQPPMYGHALADLSRRGIEIPGGMLEAATDGLWFLLARRGRVEGLVALCHPWESGADDSPRWDHWYGTRWSKERAFAVKGELLEAVQRSPGGAPVGNPSFRVASASFNALVAFNARELASVTGDDRLAAAGHELAEALDARWSDELRTWTDAGDSASSSGRARTVDALCGVLVSPTAAHVQQAIESLVDPLAYGGRCGPAGVHRADPTFDGHSYWRGSSWPQLSYLLWVGARRVGDDDAAATLAAACVEGALRSGLAEHWDPDRGTGLGAIPQSWAGLALVMHH
jgi:hypothetical protein